MFYMEAMILSKIFAQFLGCPCVASYGNNFCNVFLLLNRVFSSVSNSKTWLTGLIVSISFQPTSRALPDVGSISICRHCWFWLNLVCITFVVHPSLITFASSFSLCARYAILKHHFSFVNELNFQAFTILS